jgi:hypothetical protein
MRAASQSNTIFNEIGGVSQYQMSQWKLDQYPGIINEHDDKVQESANNLPLGIKKFSIFNQPEVVV